MKDLKETTASQKAAYSPKKRDSNLEVLRIIAMFLVVGQHYLQCSGLYASDGPIFADQFSPRSVFLLLFGAWGKIGINCFEMITGYFMCKSQITAKKFAKIVFEMIFYNYFLYLIFVFTGYLDFNYKRFLLSWILIWKIETNFSSCFLIFWLTIPFLNMLTSKMNERQHIRLIMLVSFPYIVLGTFHAVTMNYISWFIVIYLIASYIRLYPKKSFTNTKLWGMLMVIFVSLSIFSVIGCAWYGARAGRSIPFYFVMDSNTLLAVAVGVSAFMFFKNVKIKYSRVINTIAASTYGVLLIHLHSDSMYDWLWKDTFDNVGHYSSSYMPLHAFGSVFIVYSVCTVMDILRIRFVEKPFFKWWDRHWDGFLAKFKKTEDKIFRKLNVE